MAGSNDWIVSFSRCEKLIAASTGTTVRRAMSTSPACADRVPQRAANERAHTDQRGDARCEVRIDHEEQPGDEMRPPRELLAVYEQDEPDSAGNERQKHPCGIEVHGVSTGPRLPGGHLLRVQLVVDFPPGGVGRRLVPDVRCDVEHH